jgi:hypothetical protein
MLGLDVVLCDYRGCLPVLGGVHRGNQLPPLGIARLREPLLLVRLLLRFVQLEDFSPRQLRLLLDGLGLWLGLLLLVVFEELLLLPQRLDEDHAVVVEHFVALHVDD